MKELIKTGQYRPSSSGQALDTEETISHIWAEQPPNGECFMSLCASSEYLTNTLTKGEPKETDRVARLQ